MSENEIDELVRELQTASLELYSFVVENCGEGMTEVEIDELIVDLKGDYFSLREFVINSLDNLE